MKKLSFVLYVFLLFSSIVRAQNANNDSIQNLFIEQISIYPQEKIHVHTDKPTYISGETIWLRVHIVDALFLKQANASRYVYVELINPLADVVSRVMLRPDSLGCFYGNIKVDKALSEGNYTLRAYTRYMQNLGESYFFRKSIQIINPLSAKESSLVNDVTDNRFNVSFFPEGGHALLQTGFQMAFKALNENGLHENVKGVVFDDTGKECASFETNHLGMGQFRMYYYPERTYYAICTNENNISKRFALPGAEPGKIALKTNWDRGRLRLSVLKSNGCVLPSGVSLIAHLRGVVLYSQPWNEKREYIIFEKDFFPMGIVHLFLIDTNRNILSERLVFSAENSTMANVNVKPDKAVYQPRGKINIKVQVTDQNKVPLPGNFSISVADKHDVPIDTSSSIVSTLLLTSELKGYIESPMSYLHNNDGKTTAALDVLMMTQGWRRYNVPDILKGKLQIQLEYPVESNRQFSGKVTGVFSALDDASLSLIALNDSVLGATVTKPDDDGRFVFSNIEYPDSTQYIIQALRKKGSDLAFIEMDSVEVFPPLVLPPTVAHEKPKHEESYLEKVTERFTAENGMRHINLEEIEVKAKKISKPKTESPYYSISSSFVLGTEDIEKANFMTVFELLRRLPGITISGSEVFYRREKPMLILDDVPTENFDYNMLNVNDISDAFVLPATSVMTIFGTRGANGAIVINTKHGFVEKNTLNKNIQVFTPLGYQQEVEFYSPAYETEEQRRNTVRDLRSTIYWNPCVPTDSTGIARLSFYSADTPSQYSLIIEGVGREGHLIYSSKEVVNVEE
ncbi:MAG: hypothetical protein JXR50_12035 [Prolixibacteraceae bacterium]|nr:hypothetical protein [Prolixibacteraceae bacterium]MBN2650461.1 hypothetical protein [Prolixibacteraceae bacterium]